MRTSVAMTTYNGIKYIKELLDSILGQNDPPDEVVIVDDFSTDGTYEFVNAYIVDNHLSNWHNYRNERNIGWRANFREAFKKCSGDLIFLCDQDDIWMPYKISEMKKIMEENLDVKLLVSNYFVKDIDREEKVKVAGLNKDDGSLEDECFKSDLLTVMRPGCTYCARKCLVDELQVRDNLLVPHDAMLWGYAAIEDALFLYNRKTILFRRHSESASTPEKSLCVSRRIKEVMCNIDREIFFREECERKRFNQKKRIIERQLRFSLKRKDFLKKKSIFRMILFQMTNWKRYATVRNMLSDVYVLVLRRW